MAYREVDMLVVKDVLRRWFAGDDKKAIARKLGLDAKTVRRYVDWAEEAGFSAQPSPSVLSPSAEEQRLEAATAEVLRRREAAGRPHGEAWARCEAAREKIAALLTKRHMGRLLRLTRVRALLADDGIDVPYPTLRRFVIQVLGHGKATAPTPVADGKPGEELQVDTGWVGELAADDNGRRRRFKAWIFTPSVSRYRFVWPCHRETTAEAIEACEAAWRFYEGCFRVLLPDNTKAIVDVADPISPKIVRAFLEYSQARGFVIDPARVRRPTDKARVERSVQVVRDGCFAGTAPRTVEAARTQAEHWSREVAGVTRHRTTQRLPREHFEAVERAALGPAPTTTYDLPIWSEPVVAGQYVQVTSALYSVPDKWTDGERLLARADSQTVRIYDGPDLVAAHGRRGRGERSTDPSHFPAEKLRCAQRDLDFFVEKARAYGDDVLRYTAALAGDESKAHWNRQRQVGLVLKLAERLGAERVGAACRLCLEHDVLDASRLRSVVMTGQPTELGSRPAKRRGDVVPIVRARYLREASAFALPNRAAASGVSPEKNGER